MGTILSNIAESCHIINYTLMCIHPRCIFVCVDDVEKPQINNQNMVELCGNWVAETIQIYFLMHKLVLEGIPSKDGLHVPLTGEE